jgi:LysM repeat protein
VLPFTTPSGQTEALPVEVPMTAVESAPIDELVAAAVEPEPTAEPVKPPFFIYTVQEGDTVGGLAGKFGLSSTSVLWNNLDLENACTVRRAATSPDER